MRKSFIHKPTQNDEDDKSEKPEDILLPYLPETSRKTNRKKAEVVLLDTKPVEKPLQTFGNDLENQKLVDIEKNLES